MDGGYGLWVDLYHADTAFDKEPFFHQIFYCKDHQIALVADSFRLETISMEHDSARAGYRVFPYQYKILGDLVTRVAPIGFDAHDFVGEWGNLPWEEAAKWSDPGNLGKIRKYYNMIRDAGGYFGGEFGKIQVCDPRQSIWQVEYGGTVSDDNSVYFLVERKDKWTFIVKDIGTDKRDGCKEVEFEPGKPFQTMFAKPLEW
jgi:hypothetical protein